MIKNDLRTIYLARQKNLSDKERLIKSQRVSERFFNTFGLENIKTIHLFLSIKKNKEIETRFIYEKLWQDFPNIRTVVPRVNFELDIIESIELDRQTPLFRSAWHILEPHGNKLVDAQKIDLVLIPLLCFDKKGFRVGYGKGFYDKFLKNCRMDCLKIGLSYFRPIEEISETTKLDVTLDYCVTPEKCWKY